jgi:hypothetical protein
MTIQHEPRYREFIQFRGVGSNDVVAASVESYVSYLESVSRILGIPISPELLRGEDDVERIAERLRGLRAEKTINNYKSAMRQYFAMVEEGGLSATGLAQ